MAQQLRISICVELTDAFWVQVVETINWLLSSPGVTAPIICVRTMKQLEDDLGAVGWSLNEEQLACLNDASALTLPYPYEMIVRNSRH